MRLGQKLPGGIRILALSFGFALVGCAVFPDSRLMDPNLPMVDTVGGDIFQPDSGADRSLSDASATIRIENFQAESREVVVTQFERLGFERPEMYALKSVYSADTQKPPLTLPQMTFVVFREGGWEKSALLQTVTDLPARFLQCGIAIDDILVVETSLANSPNSLTGGLSFDVLQVDLYNRIEPLVGRLPVSRRPLFFFVGSVYSQQHGKSVGGFAANVLSEFGGASLPRFGLSSPIAQTGAVARRPAGSEQNYQFDQTISHELGHLLGLSHDRDGNENIMQPVTCKDCDFTERQCARMRESRILSR